MIRLALKLALAATALWALWTFVPVHGRTLAERWRAAGDVVVFLERAGAEIGIRHAPAGKPQARSRAPAAPRDRPSEGHTEADRAAVERLLSERLNAER